MEFEQKQRENEEQLEDAEARLYRLQMEKENLDAELNVAREKVWCAEEAQLLLEARIVVTRPLRSRERIRRPHSFVPTTTTREKPNESVKLWYGRVL